MADSANRYNDTVERIATKKIVKLANPYPRLAMHEGKNNIPDPNGTIAKYIMAENKFIFLSDILIRRKNYSKINSSRN